MTSPQRTPAHHRLVECPDCASVVHVEHYPGKVMQVEVEHSPSCPAWCADAREVALTFIPPGHPGAT